MTGSTVISDETGYDFSAVTQSFRIMREGGVFKQRDYYINRDKSKNIKARAEQVRTILKRKNTAKWHYTDRLSNCPAV